MSLILVPIESSYATSYHTVVPECFKDDNASQWKSEKFDPPLPQKPPNRSSPKFAWLIMSGTATAMQNIITIRLPSTPFDLQICENAQQVTRLVYLVPLKDVPFGDPIISRNANFGQFSTGLRNFRVKKALTMGCSPVNYP